jgi:hypothetical protein
MKISGKEKFVATNEHENATKIQLDPLFLSTTCDLFSV